MGVVSVPDTTLEKIEHLLSLKAGKPVGERKGISAPKSSIMYELPTYFDPKHLYAYLFGFNQNPILRATCHEVDDDDLEDILVLCHTEKYSFEEHLKEITAAFEEHDKLSAPYGSKALIRGYITGKSYYKKELPKGWSGDEIQTSWATIAAQIGERAIEIPPNSDSEVFRTNRITEYPIIPFNSKLFNRRVQTFRELVLHFKKLFHIRGDNSLRSIIENQNRIHKYNEKIDFLIEDDQFPHNLELFTDVDKIVQAYRKIIELILDLHKEAKNIKVSLSFLEHGDTKIRFSIHQHDVIYNKSLRNTLERFGKTYSSLIKNQLNGVCNFYLRADFGVDGNAIVNIWNGEKLRSSRDGMGDFLGGVEHLFEFVKA